MREEAKIISELQSAIRSDRMKKQGLEKEISSLARRKSVMLDEISSYEVTKKNLRGEISEISNEKDGLIQSAKSETMALSEKRKLLDDKQNEIDLSIKKNEQILNDIERRISEEKEMSSKIKSEKAKLNTEKEIHAKNIACHETAKAELSRQERETDASKKKYDDKHKDLLDKENLVIANLDKIKELRHILDDKLKTNDKIKESLYREIEEYRRLQSGTKKLNEELAEFKKKEAELERLKENLAKLIEEQRKKDAEIEIRRLRVEKIIREKGIADELRNLEKELANK